MIALSPIATSDPDVAAPGSLVLHDPKDDLACYQEVSRGLGFQYKPYVQHTHNMKMSMLVKKQNTISNCLLHLFHR